MLIKDKMGKTSKQAFTKNVPFDQELEKSSDRHELEKNVYGLSAIVSKATVDDPQVDALSKQYLLGTITEDVFKDEFNKITTDPSTVL